MFHPEMLRAVADDRIADLHAQADRRRLARQARQARREAKAARESRSERARQPDAGPESTAEQPPSPLAAVGARPAPDHERQ